MVVGRFDVCAIASRWIESLVDSLEERGMPQRQAYRAPAVRSRASASGPRCMLPALPDARPAAGRR
jgi:hypothetical protein